MKRKILVTGSAPYFPKWWKDNKSKLDGFDVYSINTSFAITRERCNHWVKSSDFYELHRDIEADLGALERKLWPPTPPDPNAPPADPTSVLCWPFHYWKNDTSGTMLFNVLNRLLNDEFWYSNVGEINLVGCDLVYNPNQVNHFYGSAGTNDPMRLGVECLKANLRMFSHAFWKFNIKAYNLSPSTETLLPFERKTL